MMELSLAFLVISSCILLYRVRCHEGVYRIPETSSKVYVKSIVPECFMDSVDDLFKTRGPYTLKAETASIGPNQNRQLFKLVVSTVRDGALELLEKFTVLAVTMVERNKKLTSQERALDFMELNVSKLSGCLEFLFDNEVDVTDVLTEYIFYSDIKYIFNIHYGENYTYDNMVEMFVRIKKQQWLEYSQRVATKETYQELYKEVTDSLDDISKTYHHLVVNSSDWLSPKSLKWRNFIESNSKSADLLKQVIFVDNANIYNQYSQTAREFDSAKLMDFYVTVGKALDDIVLETSNDMMYSFLNLILRLIEDDSNKDNSFAQISLANEFVDNFLTSVYYFENWMSYSKRLKSSKNLHSSPAIKLLQEYGNYCKTYGSWNFPNTVASFLDKFETVFEKHFPGNELDTENITSELIEESITQIDIIDNMGIHMEVMTMLLEETLYGRC